MDKLITTEPEFEEEPEELSPAQKDVEQRRQREEGLYGSETDSPETQPEPREPGRKFVLVSEVFNGHEEWVNMAEPDADYDNEVPQVVGKWQIQIDEVIGRDALDNRIEAIYESQADDPPFSNAHPVVAYDAKTKEIVWHNPVLRR